ncbi:MAG: ATP-binding protein [Cyanobacteria bacterium P01_E01_bin.42]
MTLSSIPLDKIVESDLQSLIDNEVAEGKAIDYKQELSGNSDTEKKEFLFDVSSFANAGGGDLFYGIKEDKGIPIEICGIDVSDRDEVRLQLENKIRDCIQPRIPGLKIHFVPLANGKFVLILRIPRSFAQPHMVTFKNASRFYSRNSAGKYQLDVGEIRTAFTLSQSITDRIRDFRRDRLSAIVSGETPVLMEEGAKFVLHLIPINAFDLVANLNLLSIINKPRVKEKLSPLTFHEYQNYTSQYNFDGYLTSIGSRDFSLSSSYLQVFRSLTFEATSSQDFDIYNETKIIYRTCDLNILSGIKNFLEIYKCLEIEIPVFIMLSFLNVKNYFICLHDGQRSIGGRQIDRDNLILPEIVIEDFNVNIERVMKPIFDTVWNAAGIVRSPNYDEQGNWIVGR